MTIVKLPINSPVYTNIRKEECRDTATELWDSYLNEIGHTVKRPGLSTLATISSNGPGIDGVFYWASKDIGIAVSYGVVYKLSYLNGALSYTALTTPAGLFIDKPVSFATVVNLSDQGEYVVMANGDKMIYWDGISSACLKVEDITGSSPPQNVTGIGFLDGYLIAVNGSSKWYFSSPGAPFMWDPLDFFMAESNPDRALALKIFNREVYIFGESSVDIYALDADLSFSRVPGGIVGVGCAAIRSVVETPYNQLVWLNDQREFVSWDGSGAKTLDCAFEAELQDFPVVEDCRGFFVKVGGNPLLLFRFLNQGVMFAYNLKSESWSKWGSWQVNTASYATLPIGCNAYCTDWGINLVGDLNIQRLHALTPDALTDNGDPIRPYRRTGEIDHGTFDKKISKELVIKMVRGSVETAEEPFVAIRWKDNGGKWSNEHLVTLGKYGKTESFLRLRRLGIYGARQWEVYTTAPVPFTIVDAYEDIEVL